MEGYIRGIGWLDWRNYSIKALYEIIIITKYYVNSQIYIIYLLICILVKDLVVTITSHHLCRYVNLWFFLFHVHTDNFTKFIQVLMVVVPPEKDEADSEENRVVEDDEGETEAPMIAAVVWKIIIYYKVPRLPANNF